MPFHAISREWHTIRIRFVPGRRKMHSIELSYLETAAQATTTAKAGHFALLLPIEPMQRCGIRVTSSAAAAISARRVHGAGAAAAVRAAQRVAIADADVAVAAAARHVGATATAAVAAAVGRIGGRVRIGGAAAQKVRRCPATDVGQP